MIYNDVMNIFI